ncbi:uncharacterized protein LOC133374207 [Rhineura floridana]|uniref:uncharacterized protein LOC133374207 n=1 Tax=Rhineura floridana TaxID=261503 RepID=UPI002AC831BF|nr:uncharacterized protein LOC133374207 [Rhineura floridana]
MEYPFRQLPKDFAKGHSSIQLTVYDVANERQRLQSYQARKERFQGPSFLYPPWVPHDPSAVLPNPPTVNQPFDLYIDALHYIPDNATITKVTGHFKNSDLCILHPFLAFPVLESSSRNPEFQYRAAISGGVPDGMDINTWLLFQVHTVDIDSGDLVLLVLPDQLKAWCVEMLGERGRLSPQQLLKCIIGRRLESVSESSKLLGLKVLHPYLDDHSVLLVQIYGLDVIYTPDPSGQRPGTITPRSGQVVELNKQSQLGWTAVPFFDRNYVRSGVHNAPLFQGVPSAEFLQSITSHPVKDVMAEGLRKKRLKLLATYGSVAVEVWDGHYFDDDRQELPVLNDLLAIDATGKFLATQASKRGKDMSQLVLKTLDKKSRKLGRTSLEYLQQEHFYKQAMGNVFYNVVVIRHIVEDKAIGGY